MSTDNYVLPPSIQVKPLVTPPNNVTNLNVESKGPSKARTPRANSHRARIKEYDLDTETKDL